MRGFLNGLAFSWEPLGVWILFMAAIPLYIDRLERPAERVQGVKRAELGENSVMYLRSFATAEAMRRIEDILEAAVSLFEARDSSLFQLNPVALGDDDHVGFPKLTTADSDWWQQFEAITANCAAIFLLPITARNDPNAGIMHEAAHVYIHYPGELIMIVPDSQSWRRLLRMPSELFDGPT